MWLHCEPQLSPREVKTDILNMALTPVLFRTNCGAAARRALRVTLRPTSRVSHWHAGDSDCTVNYPSTFHGARRRRQGMSSSMHSTYGSHASPPEVKPRMQMGETRGYWLSFFPMWRIKVNNSPFPVSYLTWPVIAVITIITLQRMSSYPS